MSPLGNNIRFRRQSQKMRGCRPSLHRARYFQCRDCRSTFLLCCHHVSACQVLATPILKSASFTSSMVNGALVSGFVGQIYMRSSIAPPVSNEVELKSLPPVLILTASSVG